MDVSLHERRIAIGPVRLADLLTKIAPVYPRAIVPWGVAPYLCAMRVLSLCLSMIWAGSVGAQTVQDVGRFVLDPEGVLREALTNEPSLSQVLSTLDQLDRRLGQIGATQVSEAEMAGIVARALDANALKERLVTVRAATLRVQGCLGTTGCGALLLEIDERLITAATEIAALPISPDQAAALELARQAHLEILMELPLKRAEREAEYARLFRTITQGFDREITATRREIGGWLGSTDLSSGELLGSSAPALRAELLASRGSQVLATALGRVVGEGGLRLHSAALAPGGEVKLYHSCGVERVWAIGQLSIDGLARREVQLRSWVAQPSAFAEEPARARAEVRYQWEVLTLSGGPALSVRAGEITSPSYEYRDAGIRTFMEQSMEPAAIFPAAECIYRGRTTVGDREAGERALETALSEELLRLDRLIARLGALNGTMAQLLQRRG